MEAEQDAPEEQLVIPLMVVHSSNDCTVNKKASELIRDSWIRRYGASPTAYETTDCTKEGVNCIHRKYGIPGRSTVETVFYDGATGDLLGKGAHYWVGDNNGEFANAEGPSASELFWDFFSRHAAVAQTCPGENHAPTIKLLGEATIELGVGDAFADPGATASDAEDGNITAKVTVTGSVDNSARGTYMLRYNVSDSQGCQASEVTRKVIVNSCQQWTANNVAHVAGGRAQSCYFWFYCAKGSGDYLGFYATTTTTVRKEDADREFYSVGACPE